MQYKVKQYSRGTEILIAEFTNTVNAKLFIKARLEEDAAQKINTVYRLVEFDEVIEEFDQSKLATTSQSTEPTAGSQGKQSTASFRPTPLATSPRPPGTPPKWLIDEEEEKKK